MYDSGSLGIQMSETKAIAHASGHAVLVCVYTAGVAWVLFNGQRIFGRAASFLAPFAVLLLFVISATIVGTLVLGRPALLYLEGKKSEALKFFGYTVGWLMAFTIVVLAALAAR